MAFKKDDFMKAQFQIRTRQVKVEDLKEFFGDVDSVWTVRGLTGAEMAQVNESVGQNRDIGQLLSKLMSPERAGAMTELLGLTDAVPNDLVRRIAMLKLGAVDPVADQELCVKLADAFPIPFFSLTNTILELTGKGKHQGESSASGQMSESAAPSPSVPEA